VVHVSAQRHEPVNIGLSRTALLDGTASRILPFITPVFDFFFPTIGVHDFNAGGSRFKLDDSDTFSAVTATDGAGIAALIAARPMVVTRGVMAVVIVTAAAASTMIVIVVIIVTAMATVIVIVIVIIATAMAAAIVVVVTAAATIVAVIGVVIVSAAFGMSHRGMQVDESLAGSQIELHRHGRE
jgi:hypothetical protein